MRSLLYFLLAATFPFQVLSDASRRKPVIAIYPTEGDWYLVAYQEWLAAAGATSIVMPQQASNAAIERIFQSVNGFLVPGGGDPNGDTVDRMVRRAVQANKEGDHFPVWGTCLGFEWLVDIFTGYNHSIKDNFDSEDLASTLYFTEHAASSRTFQGVNASFMRALEREADVWYMHYEGIEPQSARSYPGLMSVVNILSTSIDRNGRPYVAQMEGKHFPIFGNQFHPEKIEYAKSAGVPETPHAIEFARHLARVFVEEARKNRHMTTESADAADIEPAMEQPMYV